jgi:hypothetical protein
MSQIHPMALRQADPQSTALLTNHLDDAQTIYGWSFLLTLSARSLRRFYSHTCKNGSGPTSTQPVSGNRRTWCEQHHSLGITCLSSARCRTRVASSRTCQAVQLDMQHRMQRPTSEGFATWGWLTLAGLPSPGSNYKTWCLLFHGNIEKIGCTTTPSSL